MITEGTVDADIFKMQERKTAMNAAILEKSDRYDLRPQSIEPAPEGNEFTSQFRIEVLLRDGDVTRKDVR